MTSNPNECQHGSLRRQCEICALTEERDQLRGEVERLTSDYATILSQLQEQTADSLRLAADLERLRGLCAARIDLEPTREAFTAWVDEVDAAGRGEG